MHVYVLVYLYTHFTVKIKSSVLFCSVLISVRTREEAADVIRGTKQELKYGGFNLTKYVVNDTQLLQSIDVADRAKEVKEIQSDSRRFNVFVANRVSRIRENTKPNEWCHIIGKENPADILSRGCNASSNPPIWTNGPQFLSEYNNLWSVSSPSMSHMLVGSSVVKRLDSSEDNEPCICVNNVDTETDNVYPHQLDILIQHYSSYYRLKKAIC